LLEVPGAGSRLELRLSTLEEVEGWILSWGTHATVLRPGALIEKLKQTTAQLARRYAAGAVALVA